MSIASGNNFIYILIMLPEENDELARRVRIFKQH